MIELIHEYPISVVCSLFGVSLLVMIIVMISTEDEDNNEPPYGI